MNYKSHLIVSFVCFCILVIILLLSPFHQTASFKDMSLWLIICLFGSLAPDLDYRYSKIHEWSCIGSIFSGGVIYLLTHEIYQAVIITMLLLFIIFSLSKLKHRGIMHHSPGLIMFAILLYVVFYLMNFTSPIIITMFGSIGYLSHLVTDCISSMVKSRRK